MLLWTAIITYLSSGSAAIYSLLKEQTIPRRMIYTPATIGLIAHTASIGSEVIVEGMLKMSLLNSISISVWMTISMILISALTKPIHNLFTFFMPAGAVLLIIALVAPQMAIPKSYSTGVLLHIFMSLLAYSILIITTLQAILVNVQTNHLHRHQLNNKVSKILPPLQSMERLMFEWLMVGFVLLTAAITTGVIYIENLFAQHLIHKTVLTFIGWGFLALLIFGHFYLGWRGQRASRLIYFGFAFLAVAFIGSKFVLEYLLKLN